MSPGELGELKRQAQPVQSREYKTCTRTLNYVTHIKTLPYPPECIGQCLGPEHRRMKRGETVSAAESIRGRIRLHAFPSLLASLREDAVESTDPAGGIGYYGANMTEAHT